jgi:hypothetical protein
VGGKAIPKDLKITGRLKLIEAHDGTHKDLASRPPTLESAIGVRVRGNSSSNFDKKSFALELRDDKGVDRELPMLGMPAESDWVLYACFSDKTCLRNVLIYEIGRAMGRWAPRTRFAEVFLDGKYHGLYVVIEKIKRGKGRTAIPKPAADATGDLTGGYIIKRDGPPEVFWTSKAGTKYDYHSPPADEITSAQRGYIQQHMDRFETAMLAPDFAHSERGYRAFIDVQSWADFMIIMELTNNVDAYDRSAFLYKQSMANGNKLFMGPLWDFDIGLGNVDYEEGWKTDVLNMTVQKLSPDTGHNIPFYWGRIGRDPAFQRDLKCRWQELRKGPLLMSRIDAWIEGWTKELAAGEKRDHARWPVMGKKLWPNYFVGKTYDEEVRWLRDWIDRRLRFLDANLPGVCPAS